MLYKILNWLIPSTLAGYLCIVSARLYSSTFSRYNVNYLPRVLNLYKHSKSLSTIIVPAYPYVDQVEEEEGRIN
jgi:hypothetical protein